MILENKWTECNLYVLEGRWILLRHIRYEKRFFAKLRFFIADTRGAYSNACGKVGFNFKYTGIVMFTLALLELQKIRKTRSVAAANRTPNLIYRWRPSPHY